MSDLALMQTVKAGWGTAIAEACDSSSVSPTFLAALIAGESGGHNDAKRFEPGVLARLWEVLLGRKTAYGQIGRTDLLAFVSGVSTPIFDPPQSLPADAFQRVDALATSWGLTQIMGYHILGTSHSVDDLRIPEVHLVICLQMLAAFAEQFQLDVTKEFEQLFRCWNTGTPDGKTFDPAYVNNGLARMAIWTSL